MQKRITMSATQKALMLFGPGDAKLIQSHAQNYEANLLRLSRAASTGRNQAVRAQEYRLLRSHSARITCLVRAIRKKDGLTISGMIELLDGMDVAVSCNEPVNAYVRAKSSGNGWRPIAEFGPLRRARQLLIAELLQAKFSENPSVYLRRGKGADKASDKIVSMIQAGARFFVIADIANFYPSVQQGAIAKLLGLSDQIVENTLLIGPEVSVVQSGVLPIGIDIQAFDGAVRQGLTQGSR